MALSRLRALLQNTTDYPTSGASPPPRIVETVAIRGLGPNLHRGGDQDHDDTLSSSPSTNNLSALARTIGVNDPQLDANHQGYPSTPGTPDDRNRVLRFQVPEERVQAVGETLPRSLEIQSRDGFPNGEIQD